MHFSLHEVRVLLAQWRTDDALVESEADLANLSRIRWFAPIGAFFGLLTALVFGVSIVVNMASDTAAWRWGWGSVLMQSAMGLALLGAAWLAKQQPRTGRTKTMRYLPIGLACFCMADAIVFVYLEQWGSDSVTPYIYVCLLLAVSLLLKPSTVVWIYCTGFVVFNWVLGQSPSSPHQILTNRLDALTACAMGMGVSIYLWRRYVAFYVQQEALQQANAELQDKQRELQRLTRTDGLTNLFNRKTFVELTQQELQRAQRQNSSTAILVMDLDYFKKVNDTWGHPAGDAVLKHAATLASSAVRSTDLVARLGGEEFIVLLPSTSIDAARRLAEKIRAKIEAHPAQWSGQRIPVTVSIGSAGCTAAEKLDFDALYYNADKALYLAKQRGRNRVI
ncbi:GGDEF domain-containing protein [Rhodoferax aquaticus]|uniref:diguanylate cyclase n=1 Tax=Rhodoferax aquaticus TaxID=2527691 RepID=A0A515ESS3_9BURK|nr:GGDEF domain-containing protein [Rhodoferax aquaticus]QDL55716.1 GGDEF domain-containing protein [Rhodoferax aquaticus]